MTQRSSGSSVARNTILNLASQGLPLIVGIIALPRILSGLGTARYGVFTLAWTLVGYLSVLDLGLTRATTKFVAERAARGDTASIPRVAWTTIALQVVLGVIGGGALALLAPLLAFRVLKIAPELQQEAYGCFLVLSVAVPVVLLFNSLRGVLEAAQRFDLVNIVRAPFNALYYLLPLGAVLANASLVTTMQGFVVAWIVGVVVQLWFCARVFPGFLKRPSFEMAEARRLLGYGGWAAVSGVISPILVYADRVIIGSVLTVVAVSYYSAPFDIVTRLLVIPSAMVATLFPAFSAIDASREQGRLPLLLTKATKYLLVAVGFPLVLIIVFATPALSHWLGSAFAQNSAIPLRILAVGVLINALAQVPFAMIQARGRPDLTARFHLAELPLHIGLVWLGVHYWGITGAAMAWTLRVAVDAALLYGAAMRLSSTPFGDFSRARVLRAAVLVILAGVALSPAVVFAMSLEAQLAIVVLVSALTLWLAWSALLDVEERAAIRSLLRSTRGPRRAVL